MTPFYDILAAQPSVDTGQVNEKKFKLAMSVGTNNHYRISEIKPRHFLQMVDRCNFDAAIIRQTLEALLDTAVASAEKTIAALGNTIPAELANSVLAGNAPQCHRVMEEG